MKNIFAFTVAVLFIFTKSIANDILPKLVEEVAYNQPNDISIPFSKYVFPNGLIVIVHEDHNEPQVYVQVTYKAGASRELPGQSGYAHFFEHLMFEGTNNLSKEALFKIFGNSYSDFNADTHLDFTRYYEQIPTNYLETALWMEADRMVNIGNSITQQKLDLQLKIITNEKNERSIEPTYGTAEELAFGGLYPKHHPYAWPVIGYIADLEKASVEDMKSFFYKWYCPNNAVLTISGDIRTKDAIALVSKYFGNIPPGDSIEPVPAIDVIELRANKIITFNDNAEYALVKKVYPTVPTWHKDEAALDALSYIFNQPDNKKRLFGLDIFKYAQYINIVHPCDFLAGTFQFDLYLQYGNYTQLNDYLDGSLKTFNKKGFTTGNLDEFKLYKKYQYYSMTENMAGIGNLLSFYELTCNTPNMFKKDWERYQNVSEEEVMQVFRKYIYDKNCICVQIVPAKIKDEYKDISTQAGKTTVAPAPNGHLQKINQFESDPQPIVDHQVILSSPTCWTSAMKNNIKLVGIDNKQPITHIQVRLKAGAVYTSEFEPGVPFISSVLLNKMQISENLDDGKGLEEMKKLGSNIFFSISDEYLIADITSLNDKVPQTLELFRKVLENRYKINLDMNFINYYLYQQHSQDINDGLQMAKMIFYKHYYPSNYVLHHPLKGKMKSYYLLDKSVILNYMIKTINTNDAEVYCISSLDKSVFLKGLQFLTKFTADPASPAYQPGVLPGKSQVYFYNNSNTIQAHIIIGTKGLPASDTGDYIKLKMLNYIIGGSLGSRINSQLREIYGYTYSINSEFLGTKYYDPFVMQCNINPEGTDTALQIIIATLSDIQKNGITDAELKFIKNMSEAQLISNSKDKITLLSSLANNDSSLSSQKEIINNITKEELNKLAAKYLHPDKLIISVVGDKKFIYWRLKKLKLPLVELVD